MMHMSETVVFTAGEKGWEMWRYNKSPYPIYLGSVTEENFEEEVSRQEGFGFNVWVKDGE